MTLLVEIENRAPSPRDADMSREANRRNSPVGLPSRKLTLVVFIVAAALLAALCAPALCGLVYTADDLGAFHLPLRAFYARALSAGDSFDWCPDLYGGFYLTGEGQAGTYHPLHWLLYRWLPLPVAWNIECLANYPLMFIGGWLFLRRRELDQAGALFGSIVITFCGFNLLHFVHVNAIAVVAHVPWLLYAIDGLRTAHDTRNRAGILRGTTMIAALTGSQLLLGYPQYVIYSLIAEVVYVCVNAAGRIRKPAVRPALAPAGLWSLAKILGLALAAVQVLPTVEMLGDSVRQDFDRSFSMWGSLHPLNAVQLIAPYLFTTRVVGQNTHELGLYAGAATLLLAMLAIANRRTAKATCTQTALRFAIALIAIGVLIALGAYGPVQRLQSFLPVGYLRFPSRAIILVHMGLGILAALGFRALVENSRVTTALTSDSAERTVGFPHKTVALTVAISIAMAIVAPLAWPEHTAAPVFVWCGPVLVSIAALLIRHAARGSRIALCGVIVFCAIDLGTYGLSYAVYRDVTRLDDYIAQTPAPPQAPGLRVALDLAEGNKQGLRNGNQIMLAGYSRIDGYAGLEPARSLDYRDINALRLAGVRFIAANAPVNQASLKRGDDRDWFELLDALPRARLVQKFRSTETPRQSLASIDAENEVMIEPQAQEAMSLHVGKSLATGAARGSAGAVIDCPGHILIESNSPQPAILVLSESFHAGWTATAGGMPVKTFRLNGDFLGCLVKPGHSTVEFRFAPDSLVIGRLISICGLGLLVMLLAASRFGARLKPVA